MYAEFTVQTNKYHEKSSHEKILYNFYTDILCAIWQTREKKLYMWFVSFPINFTLVNTYVASEMKKFLQYALFEPETHTRENIQFRMVFERLEKYFEQGDLQGLFDLSGGTNQAETHAKQKINFWVYDE